MNIDLKKFKKIAFDKASTTLKHSDGHTIKIAHAPLTPKVLLHLKALPTYDDGGEIEADTTGSSGASGASASPKEPNKKNAAAVQKGAGGAAEQPGWDNVRKQFGFSQGGQIKQSNPKLEESKKQPPVANYADGDYVDSDREDTADKLKEDIEDKASSDQNAQANAAVTNSAGYSTPQEAVAAQANNAPVSITSPVAAVEETSPQQDAPDQTANSNTASTKVMPPKAAPKEQQALDEAAAQPVPPSPKGASADYYAPENVKADMAAENLAWAQDIANGHITPQTYSSMFAKKDTLGKIGMIFGAMLGTATAQGNGGNNPFINMMDKQIQNDLEAQKQSKSNAVNYVRLAQEAQMNKAQITQMRKQGNLTDAQARGVAVDTQTRAFALAQAHMLQSSYHNLVTNVNKMPEGPQKEVAKQQLGYVYSKMGEKINDINDQVAGASAYTGALFGQPPGSNGQTDEAAFQQQQRYLRAAGGPQGELRAKDNEDKHFPGLGQSSIPLTSGDREKIDAGMTFQDQLGRFTEWTKHHSGSLSPAAIAEGSAMAKDLSGAYRQATNGGVYREGEQRFIGSVIDQDPTKFFNSIRVIPKLKAVQADSAAQLDHLVKSKGFSGYKPQVQAPAQQAPTPQIKSVGGVQYMRGPNGEAVRVK